MRKMLFKGARFSAVGGEKWTPVALTSSRGSDQERHPSAESWLMVPVLFNQGIKFSSSMPTRALREAHLRAERDEARGFSGAPGI
jgi:hypothetical protein